MARLTQFHYRSGTTVFHRHDPRFKLVELVLLSLATAGSGGAAQSVVNAAAAAALVRVGVSFRALARDLRWMAFFLAVVFMARAFGTPGDPLLAWKGVALTREGVAGGALVCWRLAGILLLSLLFVRTTSPPEMKATVQWMLKPVPLVPERRAALMMGLMLRFIPLLLQQAAEHREAMAARGFEACRNPLRRLKFSTFPLLRRTLLSADRLALAMTARSYSEERTDPRLAAVPGDGVALGATVLFCSILAILF